jgi:photosystem II stability/assembly factor-like uncharacterized protein
MSKQDRTRMTTHKVRADWFQERTTYPGREHYPSDLLYGRPKEGPPWEEVGPSDSGGRLTSLVIDPGNRDHIFVGAAGGGVWRSTDAGKNWKRAWSDREKTLNIGALAIRADRAGKPPGFMLYAGTGEANLSSDNYPGVGLFRSADAGASWKLAGSVDDQLVKVNGTLIPKLGLPRRIGAIAIDPSDPKHILVGGVTHTADEIATMMETRDDGTTWDFAIDGNNNAGPKFVVQGRSDGATPFVSGLSYYCHAVAFHPTHQNLVFAAVEARGMQSGIWISRDGGENWEHAVEGLPSAEQFGRTSIAFAGDGKTVYALAGQQGTNSILGVYRSDDLGHTWIECGKGRFARDGQLSYTNCIAVHPDTASAGTVVVGSLDLHKSTDGGKTWVQISDGRLLGFEEYVHHDHHAVALHGDRIYSANDGGFAISEDGGTTWETRNSGLAVAMFYDIDVSPAKSECLGGGTQDNGTWFRGPVTHATAPAARQESQQNTSFRQLLQRDGGWTCYDPDDPEHIYAASQRMELWRHTSEQGWVQLKLGIPPEEAREVWMAAVAMDSSPRKPAQRGEPRAVYISSTRVWRSLDDGETWKDCSPVFDRSVITALEVAPADPQVLYVGTTNGGFFRSRDGGQNWSRNLAGPVSPGRLITRIETRSNDAEHVHYTVGLVAEVYFLGPGGSLDPKALPPPRLRRNGLVRSIGDRKALFEFDHLYTSTNGGDAWDSRDAGNLPNLPHNAVIALPRNATAVAHDGGVAVDVGNGFADLTGTLPNVRITDLVYHERDRILFAATYGRGIWSLTLADALKWAATAEPLPGGYQTAVER